MRRHWSQLLAALPLLFMISGSHAQQRPNILVLMAEDLSPRIGAFGDPVAVTPQLDALAREGVRYTQVFTTAGVCAPSRAAHITGAHQIAIGAQHMRSSSSPNGSYKAVPPAQVKAYPELLRASGYYTFTDTKLDYQFSGSHAGSGPISIWDDEGLGTHWSNRAPGQPFFGLINLLHTHESGTFAPLGQWPVSLTHFGMQVMRAITLGRSTIKGPVTPEDIIVPPYYPDIPSVRETMARHYNNISAMDTAVGQLLEQLERDGLAENTIVIWTTDHGDGLPRAKRELFDSGIRVPMIIRWPQAWRPKDLAPGATDDRLISLLDFAPTVLALAGVEAPDHLQGRNFSDPSDSRGYIFAARDRIDEVTDRQRAVRDKRFKYIRSWHPEVAGGHPLAYRDIQSMTRDMRALWQAGALSPAQARWFEPVAEEQLYDLHQDPHELNNLADRPEYSNQLQQLRSELDAWLARTGDQSQNPETAMIESFLCQGEPCATLAPRIVYQHGRVTITSETEAASIVYRLNGGRWQVYTHSFSAAAGDHIAARAQRYGWEASKETDIEVPRH